MRLGGFMLAAAIASAGQAQDSAAARSPRQFAPQRPRAEVILHFKLIAAVSSPTRDPAIADVDSVLRGLFRFAGYRLVAQGSATSDERQNFALTMVSAEGERFHVSGTASGYGLAARRSSAGGRDDTLAFGPNFSLRRGAGAEPLIIVDGVIVSGVGELKRNSIESIEVVKGPMASVTYGPLAAGGAISITTKKENTDAADVTVQLARGGGNSGGGTPLFSTGLTVPFEQTVVLGSVATGGKEQALILTMSPERPPPPKPGLQPIPAPAPAAASDRADPRDVASAAAIVTALYDVISGPAGQPRDWDRFRSLFVAGARLIPTGAGADGKGRIRVMTPDEYAASSGPRLEQAGFFEREIARTSETFGGVTHAFSTYESRRGAKDEKPFARGINSIQLFNDGTRWWVVTVFWDSERAGNPIPQRYLEKRGR
jgi:hypothetical protein